MDFNPDNTTDNRPSENYTHTDDHTVPSRVAPGSKPLKTSWNLFWDMAFGLLAILIVLGNFFTIWVFHKQRRRKRTYFLLISLAVADLLVGLLAIPQFIRISNSTERSYLQWLVSTSFDIYTGLTSIYTLAVISLERMFAIVWPLRHRTLTVRNYRCAIAIPWIVAAIFLSFVILNFYGFMKILSFNILLLFFQTTPLLTICTAYFSIWVKRKCTKGVRNHRTTKESKLAITLFLITGASLLTWTPLKFLHDLVIFEISSQISPILINIIKLLQFSNSLVNVLIYPFRIPEFKIALKGIFHCQGTQRPITERSPQPAIPLQRIA